MSPAEIIRLRVALLQQMRNITPFGLGVEMLLNDMRLAGFRTITEPELDGVLQALAKEHLVSVLRGLAGLRWRITELGMSNLTEAGV